jgi:hypothetical protein
MLTCLVSNVTEYAGPQTSTFILWASGAIIILIISHLSGMRHPAQRCPAHTGPRRMGLASPNRPHSIPLLSLLHRAVKF